MVMVVESELLSMSWWYERLKDLTIPARRVELGDVRKMLYEAYLVAVDHDLNPLVCREIASALVRKLEPFKVLHDALKEEIERHGAVFVRGDKASPKDVCVHWYWYFEDAVRCRVSWLPSTCLNACLASDPLTAIGLLVASERVIMIGDPSVVWIRSPARLSDEVRVFVYGGRPLLVSWYYYRNPAPESIDNVVRRYLELIPTITRRLGVDTYTVDMGMIHSKPIVVDLAPFPTKERNVVDPILFEKDFWRMLEEAEKKSKIILRATFARREVRDIEI